MSFAFEENTDDSTPGRKRARIDIALAEARTLRTTNGSTIPSANQTRWTFDTSNATLAWFALATLFLAAIVPVLLLRDPSVAWIQGLCAAGCFPALRVLRRPKTIEIVGDRLVARPRLGLKTSTPVIDIVDVHELRLGAVWDVVLLGQQSRQTLLETQLSSRLDAVRLADEIRAGVIEMRATAAYRDR